MKGTGHENTPLTSENLGANTIQHFRSDVYFNIISKINLNSTLIPITIEFF
jgi:hypothetical protein